MFYITPIIIVIVVISVLVGVEKRNIGPERMAAGVAIVLIGTVSLCAISFFGLLKMIFMGGFLESRGASPAEQVMIVAGYILLIIIFTAVVVFGLSLFTNILNQKRMIAAIILPGMIIPVFIGTIAGFDVLTRNINFKGVLDYFRSNKFHYGRLSWNMDKSEAMSIIKEGYYSPPEETCRASGKMLAMRYNYNNKFYSFEVMFDTKNKQEQELYVQCLTYKYGAPVSRRKGVQCGCSVAIWQLPDTKIEMTLYDEEMNGAVYTPAYQNVVIEYTFTPQYLKAKEAVAAGGM
jgi:hypothetical protein